MSKVMVAGDWHGDGEWGASAIALAAHFGVTELFHVGDFGIWPGAGGAEYLRKINATAEHYDVKVYVTPGNHEDYDQINDASIGDDGLQWIASHVALIPRGHRWEMNGRTFVSLGGAPSIDFQQQTEGRSWWRDEMITLEEAEAVAAAGHADVMLTHDAPDGATQKVMDIVNIPPHLSFWSEAGLRYAKEGRELMNIAVEGVKPKVFIHGHFHVGDERDDGTTKWLSLDCERTKKNLILLDLETLDHEWINPFAEWQKILDARRDALAESIEQMKRGEVTVRVPKGGQRETQ